MNIDIIEFKITPTVSFVITYNDGLFPVNTLLDLFANLMFINII